MPTNEFLECGFVSPGDEPGKKVGIILSGGNLDLDSLPFGCA